MANHATNGQSLVQQAAQRFSRGEYAEAQQLYRQAADRYGEHLFSANIELCKMRMVKPHADSAGRTLGSLVSENTNGNDLERQLNETQQLLEHYFIRCQELEFKLMDH